MEYNNKQVDSVNSSPECFSYNEIHHTRQNRIDSISHAKSVLKYIVDATGIVDEFIFHSTGHSRSRL